MFSVFVTLHDEHIITVREEPVLDLVCSTREMSQMECVSLFKEFKTARLRQERKCAVVYPNVQRICYLKEYQSEFLEERR